MLITLFPVDGGGGGGGATGQQGVSECKAGHEGSKSFTEERERRLRGPWDENMGHRRRRRYTVSPWGPAKCSQVYLSISIKSGNNVLGVKLGELKNARVCAAMALCSRCTTRDRQTGRTRARCSREIFRENGEANRSSELRIF